MYITRTRVVLYSVVSRRSCLCEHLGELLEHVGSEERGVVVDVELGGEAGQLEEQRERVESDLAQLGAVLQARARRSAGGYRRTHARQNLSVRALRRTRQLVAQPRVIDVRSHIACISTRYDCIGVHVLYFDSVECIA